MRILHLTSHLNVGGIATYIAQLCEGLSRRGHQVVAASGGGALVARLEACGVRHWTVPLATSAEWSPQTAWSWWALSRRLAREPVDLIHAHTRIAQLLAHGLWRSCRIPYLTTWHGFYRRRLGRRWLPCTGHRTIAISEPVRRHLQDTFRLPPERIRLIPHGVDLASFNRPVDVASQDQLRWSLGLPPDSVVVGTVARLVPSKGVSQLVEAFRHIKAQIPEATLVVVGDGEQRAHLEQLAQRLGVFEATRFAGTMSETHTVLSMMDVFVFLPALQEGFGLSLLEAMASGKPIVSVRRGGGSTWVLEDHPIGLTVEPDQPEQLARAVIQIVQDRATAQRLGREAQDLARTCYDLPRVIDQVEAVYQEVLR